MPRKAGNLSVKILHLLAVAWGCQHSLAFQVLNPGRAPRNIHAKSVIRIQQNSYSLGTARQRLPTVLAQGTGTSEVQVPVSEGVSAATNTEKPRFALMDWIARAYRRFIICLTGFIFVILLRVLNRTKIHNYETLEKLMLEREEGKGLFSYSNHHSMLDDPGLPALMMPWLTMPWKKMRWNLCNDAMYFVHPVLTHIFRLGKGLPIKRTQGPNQQYLKDFMLKLENKDWCHIFAEGKINQPWRFEKDEPHLGDFRIGPAKILSHLSESPICLPIYHVGFHDILPEKQVKDPKTGKMKKKGASVPISPIPRIGHTIDIFIGEPFDVSPFIQKFKNLETSDEVTWEDDKAYREIQDELTLFLRSKLLEVEEKARPALYGEAAC
mmetsp:Transcript_15109/g.19917  ORF Transcript_15109/g.19917 Transcript_15109/m.19917 type:complete len:381 (-) Transcript_15109:431-1573(-)